MTRDVDCTDARPPDGTLPVVSRMARKGGNHAGQAGLRALLQVDWEVAMSYTHLSLFSGIGGLDLPLG